MGRLCLPKSLRTKIGTALKNGDIPIARLYKMNTAERNAIFEQYVGKDMAGLVNGKFEQAMVAKQKKALVKWVTDVTTEKSPIRRTMLNRVNRVEKFLETDVEKGFLKDLAELKLGVAVTETEAQTILSLKKGIDKARAKWNPKVTTNEGFTSPDAMWQYGYAADDFAQYVGGLKSDARAISKLDRLKPENYWRNIIDAASATKALVATLDNSFIGRQGIKTLLRGDYKIWAETAGESFKLFGKELFAKSPGLFKSRNDAIMRTVRAEIASQKNALNGKYSAAKNGYGLEVLAEEVFPTSAPEKIPLIGRLFKASETAFSASALKMRMKIANATIAAAEKNGIDMLDPNQATSFGKLVTSMTGRGEIGRLGAIGKEINATMFSVRFLKANLDTVTAHLFDRTMTTEAKKIAVQSTLKIAASITAMLSVAKMLDEDSVDFDPRSSKFGQICKDGRCFDITGGMRGIVTLGARMVPTFHNGEWGFFTKSASSGKYTKMSGEKFGERTALDTFESFFEGKLSPLAGALRDVWKGQDFQGDKPTFVSTSLGLLTPISADTLMRELESGSDDVLIAMMAELVGVSNFKTTFRGTGKKWDQLKEKKGDRVYNQAISDMTSAYHKRADRFIETSRYDKMTTDERNKELSQIRADETKRVLIKYGGIR